MLGWSLLAVAFAQDDGFAAEDCAMNYLSTTYPLAARDQIPVDLTAQFVFGIGCGGATQWKLEIVEPTADSDVIHAVSEVALAGTFERERFALHPEAPLPAETDLLLRATPLDGYSSGYATEVPFRTGSQAATAASGPPTVELLEVSWTADAGVWLTASLTPGPAEGDVFLWLEGDGDRAGAVASGTLPLGLGWFVAEAPAEVCVDAWQLDYTGAALGPARACAAPTVDDPDDTGDGNPTAEGGCGDAEPTASIAVLLALLPFLRRRHR